MKYLLTQKLKNCEPFRNCLIENKRNTLAEATYSKLWGTGMSPYMSENTAPNYWPGKNMLGAMLTELANELPDVMDATFEVQETSSNSQSIIDNRIDEVTQSEPEEKNLEEKEKSIEEAFEKPLHEDAIKSTMPGKKNKDKDKKQGKFTRPTTTVSTPLKPLRRSKSRGVLGSADLTSSPAPAMDIREALREQGNKRKEPASSPGDADDQDCKQVKRTLDI